MIFLRGPVGHGLPSNIQRLVNVTEDFEPSAVDTEEALRLPAKGDQSRDWASILGDDDLGAAVRNLIHQLQTLGLE